MNSILLLTLVSCFLNQVICDSSKVTSLSNGYPDPKQPSYNQVKLLRYLDAHQSDYTDQLQPDLISSDYYICRRTYLNTYQPIDNLNLLYSNSMNHDLRRRY